MVAEEEIKKNCCERALRGISKVRVWSPRKKSKRIAVREPLEAFLRAQKQQKSFKNGRSCLKNHPTYSAGLKIMIHKGWPRLFAVDSRQEAADEEDGV